MQSVDSKSGTVTFKNVQTVPADVSTASLPPENGMPNPRRRSGYPLGIYGSKRRTPEPTTVEPRKTVKMKVTFGDSNKVPQRARMSQCRPKSTSPL
jgi:hypothetical protein